MKRARTGRRNRGRKKLKKLKPRNPAALALVTRRGGPMRDRRKRRLADVERRELRAELDRLGVAS